jgi:hypothetical protein
MLIDEKITAVHNGVEVRKKFDNNVYLNEVEQIRKQGLGQTGDNRLVGRIPMHLIEQWAKEAGITWSDRAAMQDLVKRKMLSGDFDKFRVWKGKY